VVLVDKYGMADCDYLFEHAIEIDELEVVTVAFGIAFIVFLDALVEEVVESLWVSEVLKASLVWLGRKVGVAEGGGRVVGEL
jgi:hypothetical protein